jgi:hypothetical protein
MKNFPGLEFVRIVFAILVALSLSDLARAAGKKEDAHVTQVIHDVRLLAPKAGARPAAVNDAVKEGQAVRTGGDSRAELTFIDQTITRLGANTIFAYGQGAKEFDLSNGAALIVVPKEVGTVKINTAAATAAVTGFTLLVESHPRAANKWMLLDGEACVKRLVKGVPTGACITLHAGDMLILEPGTQGSVHKFDIQKTLETALLLTEFGKLPKWALNDIQTGIDGQNGGNPPPGGNGDPTGQGAIDQKNAASSPPPKFIPPPGHPPGN